MSEAEARGHLQTAKAVQDYVMAGHGIITVRSKKTGSHFTYKLATPQGKTAPIFVKVLTGDDNTNNYSFIGTLFPGRTYHHSIKSRIGSQAPSVIAFKWLVDDYHRAVRHADVWHEGVCGRCGRKLTVPSSIERGIGPDCAEQMGLF